MKFDRRLPRYPLKGTIGDANFALLCGGGHNIRKILTDIRALITAILAVLITRFKADLYRPKAQMVASTRC